MCPLGIAIQRKLCNGKVIAAGNDSRILNPLQTSGIFGGCGALPDNGILEFLILLGKLTRNGLKTFLNAGLVLFFRILHHVILIGAHDVTLDTEDFIHLLAVHKGLHCVGHPANNSVLQ